MGDDKMVDEFGNPQQRAAVCNSYFEKEATAGMEDYIFSTPEGARKKSREIGFDGEIHSDKMADGTMMYFPAKDEKTFQEWFDKNDSHSASEEYEDWGAEDVTAAEYQGRKVTLNKPFRTPGQNKKFAVYTKNESGNVVIVRFGDPNMEIKRDDPERRKNFRSRHNCDSPGPKWKARYWSCYQWRSGAKVKADEDCGCGSDCCDDTVEANDDPRSTPAPPKDRKKGSKKNKPGSARPGGKVTFSEAVTNSLKKKVKEHNEKNERKVTLGMLKAVYRRGAGAYSTSHRPGVSRAAWSMARVNAFLTLVRRGRPANSKYTQDNDLLPKGHPRKASEEQMFEEFISKMIRKDVFDNPGEAMDRAKEMGLDGIHSHEEDGMRVFMPGKTHEEYMEKNQGEDIPPKREEVEGYKHKDDEYMSDYHNGDSCPPGQEMKNGRCQRVAVTLDIDILDVETSIVATTGETIVRISGIAFHEGVNKNSWGIRPQLAKRLADDMVGADVTLNHPKAKAGRFTRNMDGGVDEAVVGTVTKGSYHERNNGYVVKYVAEVRRPELFEALESGLWMKTDYGVSIGGTGVPSEVIEADVAGGRPTMWFADDFKFDHLAIVHRPAYPEANIEKVERVKADENFKYQTAGSEEQSKVNEMTDDVNEIETMASEIEALKASLVLEKARIAEFEAAETARAEENRMELVRKASELGLSGHDEFTTETLESMIASWEASRPVVEEKVVEMAPVEASVSSEAVVEEKADEPVVANYLNGQLVESSESLYARCYNSWVNAYNGVIATDETPALRYEELKN
jgi:hypothetical protein